MSKQMNEVLNILRNNTTDIKKSTKIVTGTPENAGCVPLIKHL